MHRELEKVLQVGIIVNFFTITNTVILSKYFLAR